MAKVPLIIILKLSPCLSSQKIIIVMNYSFFMYSHIFVFLNSSTICICCWRLYCVMLDISQRSLSLPPRCQQPHPR